MSTPAATQPAEHPSTKTAWWTAATLATLKLAQKVFDWLRIRTAFEERMYLRLEANFRRQLATLESRIRQLEEEKTALQTQNSNQQGRIESLERELAADKALRHQLRGELAAVTLERDAARAELAKRDGK